MERELWDQLYTIAVRLDNIWTNGLYRTSEVVVVYLWAVIHDRPTAWACKRSNWHGSPPSTIPPQWTMSRRLRSRGVQQLLRKIEEYLGGDPREWWVQRIDSKPLPVGPHSKDPDAKNGHAAKGFALGYRLHAVWPDGPLPSAWSIEPMNVGDAKAARKLLAELPGEGYVVGDKQYDSNPLHRLAEPRHQVVAQQKRPGKDLGHRRHEPSRLHSIEMTRRKFGEALIKYRDGIERQFGNLTSFWGGLSSLPCWVRRKHRVQLWVQAKLIINAMRQIRKSAPLTAPA